MYIQKAVGQTIKSIDELKDGVTIEITFESGESMTIRADAGEHVDWVSIDASVYGKD